MDTWIQVTKQDGRTEPFIREKLVVSAFKSGATPEDARAIAQQIESRLRQINDPGFEVTKDVVRAQARKILCGNKTGLLYDRAVKRK